MKLVVIIGAPLRPPLEPQHETIQRKATPPFSSVITNAYNMPAKTSSSGEFRVVLRPKATFLVAEGVTIPLSDHSRTTTRTNQKTNLELIKEFARQNSELGFRVTAYAIGDRIKVEVRSGRKDKKHAWKKSQLCDTRAEAIRYIREQQTALHKKVSTDGHFLQVRRSV